jgi:murein L,D-transpeptidase YcbB/YkuD
MTLIRKLAFATIVAGAAGCHSHAQPPPPTAVPATKPEHERGEETGTPIASTPQGLLREGAERKIQERLRAKGLLREAQVTGSFDASTQETLRQFQRREGLPATGLPSYETVEHLGLKLDSVFHGHARRGDTRAPRNDLPR